MRSNFTWMKTDTITYSSHVRTQWATVLLIPQPDWRPTSLRNSEPVRSREEDSTNNSYAGSDCKGDVYSVYTKDQLLTNIMIYWVTNSITSSVTLYKEFFYSPLFEAHIQGTSLLIIFASSKWFLGPITVPVSVLLLPEEPFRAFEGWFRSKYANIVNIFVRSFVAGSRM